jgi:hypothetical protein
MTYLISTLVAVLIAIGILFWVWLIGAFKGGKQAVIDPPIWRLRVEVLKLCEKYPDVFLEDIKMEEDSYGIHYDLTFDIPHMDDRKFYAIGIYEQELLIDEAKVIRIIDSLIRDTFEKVV